MPLACDLELDANGEETFWVDKAIVSTFSGRLNTICNQSSTAASPKMLKVILHDLPGGSMILDQILRFCYNNGRINITPANACLLNFAAHYMEMTKGDDPVTNLVEQTVETLKGVPYWAWCELLLALRQCQDHESLANSSGVFDRVSNSVVGRINSTLEASPANSSPESSAFRASFDTRSTLSTKNSSQRSWWFDDLAAFETSVIEVIVKRMVSVKMHHGLISRFLLYYLRTRTVIGHCPPSLKRKILQVIIELLYSLDRESVSCKGLFWVLRLCLPLNLSECHMEMLDTMIGCQIDQATLDYILVPASTGADSLYDVNLVLRFLKSFLNNGGDQSIVRLKRVGSLVDLYLAEVAPDPCLKLQKFISLAVALPDSARDSHDGLYQAIDMYIEVHSCLSEEQKLRICCVLNYEKLSSGTCIHLVENSKLPSRTAIQALVSQQCKLKNLLQDTNFCRSLPNSPCKDQNRDEQIVLYAKNLDLTAEENIKLKVHLQGMQCRVLELEKICKRMQSQVTKVLTGGRSTTRKSIPKLCR